MAFKRITTTSWQKCFLVDEVSTQEVEVLYVEVLGLLNFVGLRIRQTLESLLCSSMDVYLKEAGKSVGVFVP